MARIPLTSGFQLIPEGTHIFRITKVEYKKDFGKMKVTMETADGKKHIEQFSLRKSDGEWNEGALNAFSYFSRVALNDFQREGDIDPEELVDCFMECDVVHEKVESTKRAGQMVTFARLDDKRPSDGFPTEKKTTSAEKKSSFNLDDILG